MTDDEDLWSDEISAIVDAAFETVSRNPSDHEEAFAYRRAIATAMRQPTQSDAEITEADCNVAEYIAGDRARDLDYQVVAYHRKWSVLEERAKIVAWLRKEAIMSTDTVRRRMNKALDQIEAGEHLK